MAHQLLQVINVAAFAYVLDGELVPQVVERERAEIEVVLFCPCCNSTNLALELLGRMIDAVTLKVAASFESWRTRLFVVRQNSQSFIVDGIPLEIDQTSSRMPVRSAASMI